jgi:hypothetical protein
MKTSLVGSRSKIDGWITGEASWSVVYIQTGRSGRVEIGGTFKRPLCPRDSEARI